MVTNQTTASPFHLAIDTCTLKQNKVFNIVDDKNGMKYDNSRNDTIMGNDSNVLVDYPNNSMFFVLMLSFRRIERRGLFVAGIGNCLEAA
jgi:hypothetical protein